AGCCSRRLAATSLTSLSLHDALPISQTPQPMAEQGAAPGVVGDAGAGVIDGAGLPQGIQVPVVHQLDRVIAPGGAHRLGEYPAKAPVRHLRPEGLGLAVA